VADAWEIHGRGCTIKLNHERIPKYLWKQTWRVILRGRGYRRDR
jgi:hypothetical protein